jgi:hypothetical protein
MKKFKALRKTFQASRNFKVIMSDESIELREKYPDRMLQLSEVLNLMFFKVNESL